MLMDFVEGEHGLHLGQVHARQDTSQREQARILFLPPLLQVTVKIGISNTYTSLLVRTLTRWLLITLNS